MAISAGTFCLVYALNLVKPGLTTFSLVLLNDEELFYLRVHLFALIYICK